MFVTGAVGPATGGPDQTVLPGSILDVPAHPVRVEHWDAPPQGKQRAIPESPQPRGTRFCQHKIYHVCLCIPEARIWYRLLFFFMKLQIFAKVPYTSTCTCIYKCNYHISVEKNLTNNIGENEICLLFRIHFYEVSTDCFTVSLIKM